MKYALYAKSRSSTRWAWLCVYRELWKAYQRMGILLGGVRWGICCDAIAIVPQSDMLPCKDTMTDEEVADRAIINRRDPSVN